MMWDGDGYWGHGGGWEGWLMLLFMIILIAAVVVAVVFLVRYLGRPQGGASAAAAGAAPLQVSATESPKDILKRRYAAGEIEREEYLQKLGDL